MQLESCCSLSAIIIRLPVRSGTSQGPPVASPKQLKQNSVIVNIIQKHPSPINQHQLESAMLEDGASRFQKTLPQASQMKLNMTGPPISPSNGVSHAKAFYRTSSHRRRDLSGAPVVCRHVRLPDAGRWIGVLHSWATAVPVRQNRQQ